MGVDAATSGTANRAQTSELLVMATLLSSSDVTPTNSADLGSDPLQGVRPLTNGDKVRQRADPCAVGLRIQIRHVEQHRLNARGARAEDVDVKEIADVNRRRRLRADAIQREMKEPRIRLLDPFVARVEERVDRVSESQPSEHAMQRAVRVGQNDQSETRG